MGGRKENRVTENQDLRSKMSIKLCSGVCFHVCNCWLYNVFILKDEYLQKKNTSNSSIYLGDSLDNVLAFVPCKVLSDIHKGTVCSRNCWPSLRPPYIYLSLCLVKGVPSFFFFYSSSIWSCRCVQLWSSGIEYEGDCQLQVWPH